MGHPKIKNISKLRRVAKKYFDTCDETIRPYTISGLAAALNVSRTTIKNYALREDFGPVISEFKRKIEAQMEERMLMGTSAAAPSMFALKNNCGWQDKIEIHAEYDVNIRTVKELSTAKILQMLPAKELDLIKKSSKGAYEIESIEDDNNRIQSPA